MEINLKTNDWVSYDSPHYGLMVGIICEVYPLGYNCEVFVPERNSKHVWVCHKVTICHKPTK